MDLGLMLEVVVVAWTTMETSLGAVARIHGFINTMPEEEQGMIIPPRDWPCTGNVKIENLTASYS